MTADAGADERTGGGVGLWVEWQSRSSHNPQGQQNEQCWRGRGMIVRWLAKEKILYESKEWEIKRKELDWTDII
jgi:hypothetical protein